MSAAARQDQGAASGGPLIFVYDRLADADAARALLVAHGIPPASIQLVSREDEAGPVEGNFTVGDGHPDVKGDPYQLNYEKVVQRGTVVLTVDVDPSRRDGVAQLLGPQKQA